MRSRRTVSSSGPASSVRSSIESRDGALVDVEGDPISPALSRRLADEGVTLADDQRAEICLAVDGWIFRRRGSSHAAESSCSSTTDTPPRSSTTRSGVVTARSAPTSGTESTTIRTST